MPNSAFQMSATGELNYNSVVVNVGSRESIGVPLSQLYAVPASTAWPLANLAIFVPFEVFRTWTMMKFIIVNGATVSGNVDVGVFDDDGTRLTSIGATLGTPPAQSGPSAIQSFDFTDYVLSPTTADCYLGMVMDNTTGTVQAWAPTVPLSASFGVMEMASAYPLPPAVTFTPSYRSFLPEMGILSRLVV